jgi:hypothetical protein
MPFLLYIRVHERRAAEQKRVDDHAQKLVHTSQSKSSDMRM